MNFEQKNIRKREEKSFKIEIVVHDASPENNALNFLLFESCLFNGQSFRKSTFIPVRNQPVLQCLQENVYIFNKCTVPCHIVATFFVSAVWKCKYHEATRIIKV